MAGRIVPGRSDSLPAAASALLANVAEAANAPAAAISAANNRAIVLLLIDDLITAKPPSSSRKAFRNSSRQSYSECSYRQDQQQALHGVTSFAWQPSDRLLLL